LLRHYLIVNLESRAVAHHRIEDEAVIRTAIARSGLLTLAPPPGLTLAIDALVAADERA
jgi:hypothetical protein